MSQSGQPVSESDTTAADVLFEGQCIAEPGAVEQFNTICGGPQSAGHVPLLWPLIWVSIPQVRNALAKRCAGARLPFHTRQVIDYDAPLAAATEYELTITLIETSPGSCDLIALVTAAGGQTICTSTSKISLIGATHAQTMLADTPAKTAAPVATAPRGRLSGPISQSTIDAYAEFSGDDNPIHLDESVARAIGLPGTIAHGALIAAIMTSNITPPATPCNVDISFTGPLISGQSIYCDLIKRRSTAGKILRVIARKDNGKTIAIGALTGSFLVNPTAA